MAHTVYIYALSDPRTDEARYIGKTNSLHRRLIDHLSAARKGANTHCARWLRTLMQAGLEPACCVLETTTAEAWPAREAYWINHYRELGARLTNLTGGGEGFGHGTCNPNARLSDSDVIELVQRFVNQESVTSLCGAYGLKRTSVYHILRGETRTDVIPADLRQQAQALMDQRQRGSKTARVRLTAHQAREICSLHLKGVSQRELSRLFDVVPAEIGRIVHHQHWAEATAGLPRPCKRPIKRMSDAEKAEVLALRASGMSLIAIAARFEASETTIRNLCEGVGTDQRRRKGRVRGPRKDPVPLTPEQVNEARSMYASGALRKDIAQRFGVDPSSISRWIRGEHRAAPETR